jgi:hypothetical protein
MQEDYEFQNSLGYTEDPVSKKNKVGGMAQGVPSRHEAKFKTLVLGLQLSCWEPSPQGFFPLSALSCHLKKNNSTEKTKQKPQKNRYLHTHVYYSTTHK